MNWLMFRRPIMLCKPAYTSSSMVMVNFFFISPLLLYVDYTYSNLFWDQQEMKINQVKPFAL